MATFLLDYHVRCEECIDKSIEDINADKAIRLEQIVPELMQRTNTMIGECL